MRDTIARIRTEQRGQWQSGHRVPIESYLGECSEADTETILDLIYSEVLLREELGDEPTAAEYVSRFPAYSAQLVRQFELHALLRDEAADPAAADAGPTSGMATPSIPGYEIDREIGRGSWGVVYAGRQASLAGRPVAVKVLRPDRHQPLGERGLQREAAAAALVRHPNVAQVHDCGEWDGRLFVVLELVDGGSLADRLTLGPVGPGEAARIVELVARGIHDAHLAGLVHRDLKPANILLTRDGVPKVVDFGLVKRLDTVSSMAVSGTIVGTWQYMAPEQAAGTSGEVGPAADVWALGVTLHELVTGRQPFQCSDPVELLRRIRFDDVPALSPLPAIPRDLSRRDLDAIRRKCLEKLPAARYPSAAALAEDLGRWRRGEPTTARPPSWALRVWRFARHRPLQSAALAVFVTATLAGAGVSWYEWYTDPLNRLTRALARGETVAAVGPTGLPRWHRWRQSSADLELLDDGSQVASFRATEGSLLELVPDPAHTRYRFTAELRHLGSSEGTGAVGVFVGFESLPAENGWRADRWYGVEYSDFLTRGLSGKPLVRRLEGIDYVPIAHPDGTRQVSRQGVWTDWYPAPDNSVRLPPWRRLSLLVGANEVHAEWVAQDGQTRHLPVFKVADERHGRTKMHREFVEPRFPTFRLVETGWTPRRSVGVYARRAAIAFRNVTLEPLE